MLKIFFRLLIVIFTKPPKTDGREIIPVSRILTNMRIVIFLNFFPNYSEFVSHFLPIHGSLVLSILFILTNFPKKFPSISMLVVKMVKNFRVISAFCGLLFR
jgi:hypothetical protein